MQSVLCKWTPRDKYFKYRNFPTPFRLSLTLECFGRNLTKIGQIHTLYEIAQSGCIPPNSRHARRLFHPRKPQANGTRGPPGVNNDGSRFPAKSNQLETLFFFNLDHSVER